MTLQFEHETLGQRVLFGANKAAEYLEQEVHRLGAERIMLIASPRAHDVAMQLTRNLHVTLNFDQVVMHVPVEVAQEARALAQENAIDVLISVGGGSATGLAKAIALETHTPIVAVPTTYSGSEGTNMWGLTEQERKTTGVDNAVLPTSIIYDATLTASLPTELAVASSLNAVAHCIDSLWGPRADPINRVLVTEGLAALTQGLQDISEGTAALSAREQLLYGTYLSAVGFASAGSGLHHKLCHVLGGTFDLPHAQTHATVLPYVVAFNIDAAPEAQRRLAQALNADDGFEALNELYRRLDAPTKLADYGFKQDDIDEAVELTLPSVPANNPRAVTKEHLTALLHAALEGTDPATLRESPTSS
jgi:maleylacetate reductase